MGTLVHRVSLKVTNQTTNGLREEGERGGGKRGGGKGRGGEGCADITLHLARV